MPITLNGTTGVVTPGATVGSLNGILKATSGVVSQAVAGTDYLTSASPITNETTAKAWVNFDGTDILANISGTYSQSGTTVTVTIAGGHGLSQGQGIYANVTTGSAVDGSYTVASITSPTIFTYIAGTSLTTSGNITLNRSSIRSQYNVSSVTKNGNGDYTVNFATAMADANYSVLNGTSTTSSSRTNAANIKNTVAPTTSSVTLYSTEYNGTSFVPVDLNIICIAIFGN